MSFLDNSGDIILDAVLTDAGRERLARGDGTFKITKFAFGDDEINYELYDGTDSRGSAFFDLQILQTPVLEAFTNNTSSMKSKLITITRTNVLYLPVLRLNSLPSAGGALGLSETSGVANTIPISADSTTTTELEASGSLLTGNFYNAYDTISSAAVVVDQGLDTDALSSFTIPADLFETQYSIQVDNRLLSLTDSTGTALDVSFVDDDSIALYSASFVDSSPDSPLVQDISTVKTGTGSPILGPLGTRLRLGMLATIDLQNSTYLFTTLGGTTTINSLSYLYIDTNLRITGLTTGYHLDLPLRLLKRNI